MGIDDGFFNTPDHRAGGVESKKVRILAAAPRSRLAAG